MNDNVKTVLGIIIALVAVKALRDLLSFFGSGPKEFFEFPELWDHMNGGGLFTDAPQAERQRVQSAIPRLTAAASAIANSQGLLQDEEGVALAALRIPQSRFEMYWLNRLFFAGAGGVVSSQELGSFLNDFLSNSDKQEVVNILKALPKYA